MSKFPLLIKSFTILICIAYLTAQKKLSFYKCALYWKKIIVMTHNSLGCVNNKTLNSETHKTGFLRAKHANWSMYSLSGIKVDKSQCSGLVQLVCRPRSCGLAPGPTGQFVNPLVVNGDISSPGAWPWMVSIQVIWSHRKGQVENKPIWLSLSTYP